MGFKVEFNSILRTDDFPEVEINKEYEFEKSDSRIYFDNIPIWLIKRDWTAQAEIQITEQTRRGETVKGKFKVLYLYNKEEQEFITEMFRRMYGWE